LRKYRAGLTETVGAFYFRPSRHTNEFAYENIALGVNSLNKILPDELCAKAGLERNTARSLRISCANTLFQSGVEE
jgi:hypothetical protein